MAAHLGCTNYLTQGVMLHTLIELDRQLLLFCNAHNSPILDSFFWTMSAMWLTVVILLPLFAIMIYRRYGIEAVLLILALALTILLCDQLSSALFKPLFQRLRPSHDPQLVVHIVGGYRGGLYGFVSSYAANTFGVAVLLISVFRDKLFTYAMLLFAVLVSYSRIYMGVHFPGDVICGAAMGAMIGWGVYLVYNKVRSHLYTIGKLDTLRNPYIISYYTRFYAVYIFMAILFAVILSFFVKV